MESVKKKDEPNRFDALQPICASKALANCQTVCKDHYFGAKGLRTGRLRFVEADQGAQWPKTLKQARNDLRAKIY